MPPPNPRLRAAPPPRAPLSPSAAAIQSPRLRGLMADLATGAVTHLVVGHGPLHAVHSQSAQLLSARLRCCTSLLSLTIRTRHCSPQALELLLRGAAMCPSLQRVSVLGGIGLADAQALANGLAAFQRNRDSDGARTEMTNKDARGRRERVPHEVDHTPRITEGGVEWSWDPHTPRPRSSRATAQSPSSRGFRCAPTAQLAHPSPRSLPALPHISTATTTPTTATELKPIHLELELVTLDEKCASIVFLRGLHVATRVMSASVHLVGPGHAVPPASPCTRKAFHKFATRVEELLSERRRTWAQRGTDGTGRTAAAAGTAAGDVARARAAAAAAIASSLDVASGRGPARALQPHTPPVSPRAAPLCPHTPPLPPPPADTSRTTTTAANAAPVPPCTARPPKNPRTTTSPSASPETLRNRRRTAWFLRFRHDRRATTPSLSAEAALLSSASRRYSPARWLKDKPAPTTAQTARADHGRPPRDDRVASPARARPCSPLPLPPPQGRYSTQTTLSLFVHRATSTPSPDPRTPSPSAGFALVGPASAEPGRSSSSSSSPSYSSSRSSLTSSQSPQRYRGGGRGVAEGSRCLPGATPPRQRCAPPGALARHSPSRSCTVSGGTPCFVCQPRHALSPVHAPPRHASREGTASSGSSLHGLTPARDGSSVEHDVEDKTGAATAAATAAVGRTPVTLDRALAGAAVAEADVPAAEGRQPRDGTPHRLHPLHARDDTPTNNHEGVASHPGALVVLPCSESFAEDDAIADDATHAAQVPSTPPAMLSHTAEGCDRSSRCVGVTTTTTTTATATAAALSSGDAVAYVKACVSQINASVAVHNAKATMEAEGVRRRVEVLNAKLTDEVTAHMTDILVALESLTERLH